MKHVKETLLLVALLLTPLFLAGLGTPSTTNERSNLEPITNRAVIKAYDLHSAIRIENDTDFLNQATTESWPGDGSEDTPFIIEGWNITADLGIGISISNTRYHFIIQDCLVTIDNGYSYYGINLFNATNGAILECEIFHCLSGIRGQWVNNLTIEGCTVYDCSSHGIFIIETNNYNVSQCTVYNTSRGILLEESIECVVHGNDVYSNLDNGIAIELAINNTVTANIVYSNGNSGIFLYGNTGTIVDGNVIFDNSNLGQCGIDVHFSDDVTIIDNQIHNNTYCGINLLNSSRTIITENIISNNSAHGIVGVHSDNTTIHDNDISDNGWWGGMTQIDPPDLCGIVFGGTTGWIISSNRIWNNNASGIAIQSASDSEIIDNEIFNNTDRGISSTLSENITVAENEIWGNGWVTNGSVAGIWIDYSNYSLVEGNTIYNNTWYGLHESGFANTLRGNEIYENRNDAISTYDSQNCTIIDNIMYGQSAGIVFDGIHSRIIENLIFDNEYGIAFENQGSNVVYGNDICWNTEYNAYDVEGPGDMMNLWYNDVTDVGNWWSDYDGFSTFYPISNFTHTVNLDMHPHQSLSLEPADSIEYEFDPLGGELEWPAQARNPSHWVLYVNGVPHQDGEWAGGNILTIINEFGRGEYTAMLEIVHYSGHSINTTTTFNVTDTTPPTWVIGPSDQEIDEGERLSAQFSVIDPSGIGSWGINDTVNFHISETGLLTNNTVLAVGVYGLQVSVEDIYGNARDYEIRIRVLYVPEPTTTTTTSLPTTSTTTTTTTNT
ncbi:MAG: right-handed parallel beta-helix repeat-containing protein, partial [Candidatus Thorarchaeota archaeon]